MTEFKKIEESPCNLKKSSFRTKILHMIVTSYCHRLLQTLSRFPLSILCSLAFCIVSLWHNHIDHFEIYLATLFSGWCWFVIIQLFWESYDYKPRFFSFVAIPVFVILSYYIRSEISLNSNTLALQIGLFLAIFCAPFLNNSQNNLQFWLFSYRLGCHTAFALLTTLILLLGAAAVLSCLEYLFSLRFFKNQYTDLGIISFTFFFPVFLLLGIPPSFPLEPREEVRKIIYSLLEYLVIPLIFVYSLILYAYIVKIAVTQTLPQGKVAYLVSSYGCIGILTYLMAIPLESIKGRFSHFFCNHFFKILIFPTALLGVGITYRLHEYGLTELRYLLVLCFIWFTLAIFFSFILTRAKAIYMPLPLLLLLASFGPWSISDLPVREQSYRLYRILVDNQILKDGFIIKSPSFQGNIKDQQRISGILDYLVNRKKTTVLSDWVKEEQLQKTLKSQESLNSEKIAFLMGIEYQHQRHSRDVYFKYNLQRKSYLNIIGYDYCIPSFFFPLFKEENNVITEEIKISELRESIFIVFNKEFNILTIKRDQEVLMTVFLNELLKKFKSMPQEEIQRKQEMILFQGERVAQLMFWEISGRILQATSKTEITGLRFGLLLNDKKPKFP